MSFAPLKFYSPNSKSRTVYPAKRNAERYKQHAESRAKKEKSPTTPRRLLEVRPASRELQFRFKVFCRQQQAIDFAQSCAMPKKVFAYELQSLGSQGQRRYLAESVFDFGRAYVAMKSNKHVYEVITEGTACKLYLDLEFGLKDNPGVKGVEVLEVFVHYLCYLIQLSFGLAVDRSHILDLDSSSEVKFSRHLIFHLPGAVFQNNQHVGNFVRYACDQLRALKEGVKSCLDTFQSLHRTLSPPCTTVKGLDCPTVPQLLSLFLMDERGSPVLLCDESVYSRNRNFRLYLSSKLGKGIPLCVARESKFKSQYGVDRGQSKHSQQFNLLVDSLVTHVRYIQECRILTFDSTATAPKRRKMDSCGSAVVLPPPAEGFTQSPYPSVDQFILSQWTRGGVEPTIRKWVLFPQGECLVYEIANSRWCENVGRHHKSNHIMIVADLTSSVFYQKCHDPECRRVDFKSREYHIPDHINPLSRTAQPQPAHQNVDWGVFENDEFLLALGHSMDSCRDPSVPEWGGGEDEDDVWLKALEAVEQDVSFVQGSVISGADTHVHGTAESDSGGEGIEEQEEGNMEGCELPCPAGKVECSQADGPVDSGDLLMTEEEMSLFLCE